MGKAKTRYSLVVAIDPKASAIHFYRIDGSDKSSISHEQKKYRSKVFDKIFTEELKKIAEEYAAAHSVAETSVILVLPDTLVAMDTVSIPTMRRRHNDETLSVVMDGLYRNRKELRVNTILAAQNKQLTTYSVTAINQPMLAGILASLSDSGMTPVSVTFAAAAATDAVSTLNSKLRSSNYLLLDISEEEAHFAFVAKGRTTGFYTLPFGHSILAKPRLAAEDVLLEHPTAELVVLNAKEKAKAKQLTMMRDEMEDIENFDGENGEEDTESAFASSNNEETVTQYKSLPHKVARKLPKFMLRPTPHTDEEFCYENFRLFVKWALDLIEGNDRLTIQGAPETVFVNLPDEYAYVLKTVNEEKEENGISFEKLDLTGEKAIIREHLSLYGGLCLSDRNKTNIF